MAHIRDVADRFAAAGFTAIAPAVFDHAEKGVELGYDEAGIKKGLELVGEVGFELPIEDIDAAAKYIAGAGKVGTVGFCWGGTIAYLSAIRLALPSVSYYGGRNTALVDQPAKAPLMFHYGERDAHISAEDRAKVQAANPDAPVYRLRCRPWFQLRPPRQLRRGQREAGVGAHHRLLHRTARLTADGGEASLGTPRRFSAARQQGRPTLDGGRHGPFDTPQHQPHAVHRRLSCRTAGHAEGWCRGDPGNLRRQCTHPHGDRPLCRGRLYRDCSVLLRPPRSGCRAGIRRGRPRPWARTGRGAGHGARAGRRRQRRRRDPLGGPHRYRRLSAGVARWQCCRPCDWACPR